MAILTNVTPFIKLLFYNSYILPKIDYSLLIWGGASRTHLNTLWKIQKKMCKNYQKC